ncbi:MAG: putative PIN family toxin of toxin-antitoxin system [Verrucomicrobiales bacterium]|jgi:putative PIN family toxin of toxin-antitoxin system
MKVILDTNVLIAALRSSTGASHAILLAIHRRQVTPVISVPLLMEYEEVSKRPGMVPDLTLDQIDVVLNQICSRAVEQRIFFRWRPFLPDPDDDMLVELAIAANVSHVVTSNVRDPPLPESLASKF